MTSGGKETIVRAGKIAILIPTFNGGALLGETIASPAQAGLPVDSYEIVVTDNASDDGSIERLGAMDPQGARVTVHRNCANLGRVENWNCALQIAEEMGFSYATFLMVGDTLRDASLIKLRDRMVRAGAALGIASYEIVDDKLHVLRVARRVCWRGDQDAGTSPERFLTQSLATGAMLYGPLGANLYRIDGPARLRFDPVDASHTDQMATALFARQMARPVVYLDRPISRWRRRAARFHSSMSPRQRLAGDLVVIDRVCRDARVAADYPKIRATLILRGLFLAAGDPRAAWENAGKAWSDGPVSWTWLARLVLRCFVYKTPWLIHA